MAKIISSILTENPCYKAGRKLTKEKKLMLHSVGCAQPNASVFVKKWNSEHFDGACVHAFIDANTGDVYQTLPWDYRGWHAGASANNTHIGVEMCEPDCIRYTGGSSFKVLDKDKALKQVRTAYKSAVELFAYLCKKYSINPITGIVSHKEGHDLGIASNHGDPEHLWKGTGSGYTMDGFRKDVKAAMSGESTDTKVDKVLYRVRKAWADSKTQKGAFTDLNNAKKCADENPGYKVYGENGKLVYEGKNANTDKSFKVRVDVNDLNIRTGPGTNYRKTGKFTKAGTFTIVEVKEGKGSVKGWGLLKSYAEKRNGWISLDYATRI